MNYKQLLTIWMISLIVLFPVAFALSINPDSLSVTVTDTTAQINWTTDSLADGKVSFGETIENVKTVPETGGFKIKHSAQLLSLNQGTKYFYKVSSSDGTVSSDLQTFEDFTTMVSPPSGLLAKDVLHNQIEIAWDKNPKASKYNIYLNNVSVTQTAALTFVIKDLTPETVYQISVSSIDNQNKESKLSDLLTLKTLKKPLELSFIQALEITKTSAKISWKTSEAANSSVAYGKTKDLGFSVTDLTAVKEHSLVLQNLDENLQYFFQVHSENKESDVFSFKTIGNETVVISDDAVTDLSKNSAVIKWKTNIDSSGEVVYSIDDSFSSSSKDAAFSKEHSVSLLQLLSGTNYFYKIKSGDTVSEIKHFVTNESLGSFLTIIDAPTITNQFQVNISGKSKVGAKLFVFVNDEKTAQIITTLPDSGQGEFMISVKLNQNAFQNGIAGNNLIKIQSWDKSGKKDSVELQIVLDTIMPALQVNPFPSYTSNSNLNITGLTEQNATVEIFINNVSKSTADVNGSGFFTKIVGLSLNNQTVVVQAKDAAGNINHYDQNVTLDKKNPTITFDTQFASETHFKFLTVTGTTEPFAKVYVTNYGEFDGCNDIQFTNKIGKCTTFVSDKYLLPSTVISTDLDPLGILFGSVQKIETGADGKFTVRVPMFQSTLKQTGTNKIQFLAVDDAQNVYEIVKTLRYNPGCNDWIINYGEIKAYPFNLYTRELTSQNIQASAFIPIQYVGIGSPKIGNIRVIKDDQSIRESILGKTGEVIPQEDGNKYVSINNYKASQYDPSTGKAYLYVPITFNKYTGKMDDLKNQINLYLKATISYSVGGVAQPTNLQAPLQSGSTQAGATNCEVFPVVTYSIQKPLDYSLWLTPAMINKSIEVLDTTIGVTQKIVDITKKAALYTTLACGAMVAYQFISASFGSSNSQPIADNNKCSEADLGLEKVYYVCDRILCPAAPPKCQEFKSAGDYKIGNDKVSEEQFKEQSAKNKAYYDQYDQLKKDGKIPLVDLYKSRDDFIKARGNDPTLFGPLANQNNVFKPVNGPQFFTTQIDKTQGYEVEYYPLQNGNLKDVQSIRAATQGNDIKVTVQIANELQSRAKRCAPDAKTLIRYTKYDKNTPSYKTGTKTTTYDDQFECSTKSSAELGTPVAGEFQGCYNANCPAFDDTKCFGKDAMDPVSGLWSSARCACLPGVKGHLENLLRIMQGAKKCLQQAQIGEVRGGYCERLLAQFVCDLFSELVLKSLFGTSSGDSGLLGSLLGDSGIKDYKSKSANIEQRLGDRYGGILKSRLGLSSDQLVNKFCIFGITLDWSVLEDVLNQVVESVDIAPMINLEGDSRAYGYDPFTGKMNIGYNVYLGVVPGGPTDLNMWLECDRNAPGGELCGAAVPKYTEIPGYRRHLEKQDLSDENIPFVVQNSQWWYNKVVLEVSYRINNKLERKVIEKPVARKGDLAVGCTFSIIEGIKCDALQFMQDQGGIIELYKPGAANGGTILTPKADTYYLGNNVNAIVRLRNEFKKDYFFIRVDYSDGRPSIEYPIPLTQSNFGTEQSYLIWLDTIGGNTVVPQTTGYQVDPAWGGLTLAKPKDSEDTQEELLTMSLDNNYRAIATIVADAEVKDNNGNVVKVEVNNFQCKLFNRNLADNTDAKIIAAADELSSGIFKDNKLQKDADNGINRITGGSGKESVCIMEADGFKGQPSDVSVKAVDITRIKSISIDLIPQPGITNPQQEKPKITLRTGSTVLQLPIKDNQQQTSSSSSVQTAQKSSQFAKSVTINVYQDTNKDGKGDTPISYDNTLDKQQQQAIQLQYQTGVSSATNLKPLIEFIEPTGTILNNDGNAVPLGFSLWDDKNAIKTLKINILGKQKTSGFSCDIEFNYDLKTRSLSNSNPKTNQCPIKIASSRNIDNNKLNFYGFELDASKLAKGPDDIYDITAIVLDGETDSVAAQKQSLRFDQVKGDSQLKAQQLVVCLGSYDCYQWKEAESASNIVPANQQTSSLDNNMTVNTAVTN